MEQTRLIRIGALNAAWGPTPGTEGLRDGLKEFGYREDKDFVIGVRFTQGDLAALPAAAQGIVQYGVDLIFTSGESATQAAQKASSQIPIVFAEVSDPLGAGLVQSLARPGGRITGVTDLNPSLGPKRLEVFQEAVPGLKRVLFPYAAADAYEAEKAKVYRDAAGQLGIELIEKAVKSEQEARATLAQVDKNAVDGILAPYGTSLNLHAFIMQASTQSGLPTMSDHLFFVERGGLASYGPDSYESGRQAARLVDQILKGADPADIPVEVNTKIEFAINLKAVKTLGLSIPPQVLHQADRLVVADPAGLLTPETGQEATVQ